MTSVFVNACQTSVDLTAATDGLCHDVAEAILDVAFFSCEKVPRTLRALAKGSLSPWVTMEDGGRRKVSHGQMMGAYLSFPLLCLQSYFAARWAARFDGEARFLVNGDDTVISAKREVAAEEYPYGFRLNNNKTIRARDIVELNSTVFLRRGGKWREVKHLRRGGGSSSYSGMMHMAKAVSSRPVWADAFVRSRIGRRWGFLPSQLGIRTYPAYLREQGLSSKRDFSALPEPPNTLDDRLRCIVGRDASPVEAEDLRDFLWQYGRGKGMKRDEWSPTPGAIRRTYHYRSGRPWSRLSFVSWAGRKSGSSVKTPRFYLPGGSDTEEEKVGLLLLEQWSAAVPLAKE